MRTLRHEKAQTPMHEVLCIISGCSAGAGEMAHFLLCFCIAKSPAELTGFFSFPARFAPFAFAPIPL